MHHTKLKSRKHLPQTGKIFPALLFNPSFIFLMPDRHMTMKAGFVKDKIEITFGQPAF